jgi:Na+/H+ antiporter NhaD/arsenite permease-like protein
LQNENLKYTNIQSFFSGLSSLPNLFGGQLEFPNLYRFIFLFLTVLGFSFYNRAFLGQVFCIPNNKLLKKFDKKKMKLRKSLIEPLVLAVLSLMFLVGAANAGCVGEITGIDYGCGDTV